MPSQLSYNNLKMTVCTRIFCVGWAEIQPGHFSFEWKKKFGMSLIVLHADVRAFVGQHNLTMLNLI